MNGMTFIASLTNLAGPDLLIILLIVLVLFGAKKLPELARGMGQAVKEFQKAKDEFNDDTNGDRPPTFNWTNGFLVNVGGSHTHQRRLKVLGAGSADFWVRQQGVESNRLTLYFGP